MLMAVTRAMRRHREDIAGMIAAETGMSFKAALAENGGAIALGEFMAGEGRRFYGRTTTAPCPGATMTVREPIAWPVHHHRQHPDRQHRLEGLRHWSVAPCRAQAAERTSRRGFWETRPRGRASAPMLNIVG
jgi:hypothetical protein